MSPVETMLSRFDGVDPDALVPLRTGGPYLFELVFGERPHHAKCYRLATRGSRGVKLRTVENGGRASFTSLRWVCEFSVAVAEARGRQEPNRRRAKRSARRGRAPASRTP